MQSIATVVQQFVFSLVTILKHPATPAHARKWFQEAATEVANKDGWNEGETMAAALFRAFGVNPPSVHVTAQPEPTPKTLPQLYLALAEALALVMSHPETPRPFVRQFKKDAQRINKLAGVTAEYIAANVKPEGIAAQAAYLQLGNALADVLERDDVPNDIWNWLGDTTNEVESLLAPQEPLKREAARLRGVLTAYVGAQTMPALASEYAPEVEARRICYQQLAEAFVTMTHLESACLPDMLDIPGPDVNINKPHLIRAFNDHLYALLMSMDWFDARTLRKFYTEARLHADQLALERERAAEQYAAQ